MTVNASIGQLQFNEDVKGNCPVAELECDLHSEPADHLAECKAPSPSVLLLSKQYVL